MLSTSVRSWIVVLFVGTLGGVMSWGAAARADLVTNGDFEANGDVQYSGGVLPPITGWSVSGYRVEVDTEGNSAPDPTATGHTLSFDDGYGNSDAPNPPSNPVSGTHSGVVSQTITTTPGTKYVLTYDFGSVASTSQSLNAQVIGATTLANQTNTNTVPLFNSHTIAFTANSTSTTLQFSDATSPGADVTNDLLLDNVHVNTNNPNAISINNASFENYNADADTYMSVRTPNSNAAIRYEGWIESGGSTGSLIDDTSNARISSGKDGTQFYQINNAATAMTQELSTLVGDNTYAFTVAIGVSNGDFNAGYVSNGATLQLLAQDPNGAQTVLGTLTIPAATINSLTARGAGAGNLNDYTLMVPFGNISPSLYGEQLVIRMNSLYDPVTFGTNSENIFDNARLTATVAPEPASLTLLAGGVVLLLRRRQKA